MHVRRRKKQRGDCLELGKGSPTLRGRVRAVGRFLKRLEVEQLLEYLSARHSEPCNCGALKNAHEAMVFLEETAAVPAERRFTD